jgi:Xaa-Pro aminopeptidase
MTRADRVSARFEEKGIDLLVVTNLVNVRYLTGFTGTNAIVVMGPDTRRFLTDFRYVSQAAEQVSGFECERTPQEFKEALRQGWPDGPVRVGFEDDHMPVRRHEELAGTVPENVELVAAGGLVEAERALKEPGELDRIRAASSLADEALRSVLEQGLAGRTERQVARALEDAMRDRGGQPSFPTIVASAEHGALPHAVPRDAVIGPSTLVTIDWGALLDGYNSDCTRTFATGAPGDELEEIYEVVERAQAEALAAVRPGPLGRDVDAVARDIIEAAGHGDHFGHGLGHGVGLEVHEEPRLAKSGKVALAPGHVVTVEPGVYVPGQGGVRIEDLVFVTETGHEVASGLSKQLTVVR